LIIVWTIWIYDLFQQVSVELQDNAFSESCVNSTHCPHNFLWTSYRAWSSSKTAHSIVSFRPFPKWRHFSK
jgi:hypothetical protein